MQEYWIKQTSDKPAYPDLIWSRPEHRQAMGKLLIIGGNSFGFSAPGMAYQAAEQAGAGSTRVLLPQSLKKLIHGSLLPTEYAEANPSGSFSQRALSEWLAQAAWADSTLLAGDLGRNSETAILIEKFLEKHTGSVVLTKDSADYFITVAKTYANRPDTTLVMSMAQLQKLATSLGYTEPFRLGMSLVQLTDTLHDFTTNYGLEIVVRHLESVCVGVNGRVSSTKLDNPDEVWRVNSAAKAAVWRLQNPSKPFEALTTSLVV